MSDASEERTETIDAQMERLKAGTVNAVMLPEGSTYMPKLDQGMKKVVATEGPGAGTYITKLHTKTILEAARAGTHEALLDNYQAKNELKSQVSIEYGRIESLQERVEWARALIWFGTPVCVLWLIYRVFVAHGLLVAFLIFLGICFVYRAADFCAIRLPLVTAMLG